MAIPTAPLPTLGLSNSTEDPKLRAVLVELRTLLTGGLTSDNIATGSLIEALFGTKQIPGTALKDGAVTPDKTTGLLKTGGGNSATFTGGAIACGYVGATLFRAVVNHGLHPLVPAPFGAVCIVNWGPFTVRSVLADDTNLTIDVIPTSDAFAFDPSNDIRVMWWAAA